MSANTEQRRLAAIMLTVMEVSSASVGSFTNKGRR